MLVTISGDLWSLRYVWWRSPPHIGIALPLAGIRMSVTASRKMAGLFVMLSSDDVDWHTVIRAYDARRLTEQAFDRKKRECRRAYTSDRGFIRFLYLILRYGLSSECSFPNQRTSIPMTFHCSDNLN